MQQRMLIAGLTALSLLSFAGCDRQEPTSSTAEPQFKTASDDLPECCMPSDEAIARDGTASAPEAAADLSEVLAANAPEIAARVGSIQTSVDGNINQTLIGAKPDLDLTFTNQDGREVNLARDYVGKTIVISTIFTSCPTPTACPRITSDFADLASRVPKDLADKIQFVLVSFDPANDTPEVLRAFGQSHGVDFKRVDLLVSDIPTTKRLMLDALDIPIELDLQTGSFSNHALMAHIINPQGYVVVERTAGSSAKISMLLDEAVRATKMPFTPPTPQPDNGG